ncbi:MAG: right-handed parallel beta-helix repeat-containing protein [Prevotellaceae bacterium]|jgi:predicted outer membrane repeat protein|nr:right-handed parallel beta-helix repeat-containing protein [Prevotellaceae bacterium]
MKKILTIILFAALVATTVNAQGIDDLGVVWSKTYGEGRIFNIKHNPGGTYTACGWILQYTGNKHARVGLIIEFDESGNELRKVMVKIPQSYINSHQGDKYDYWFTSAFKTDDGGFIAFGGLFNPDADLSEKEPDWDEIGDINESYFLTNGAWIVRLNSDMNIVSNKLVRGVSFNDGYRASDGNIVVAGFDITGKGYQGSSTDSITMLRKYNQNGSLLIDKRNKLREIRSIHQYPDGSFVAITPDRLLRINGSSLNTTSVYLNTIPELTGVPNFGSIGLSPVTDGGIFFTAHMDAHKNPVTNYQNGAAMYKLSATNQLVYKKENIPSDTIYYPPLKLPDDVTPVKYVGTATVREVVGTNVATVDNLIYELTDDGSFTYRVGNPYPEGTALKAVSQVDGFFSCGINENGEAAIAKLSTCAYFKLETGATDTTLTVVGDSAIFPGHAITYTSVGSSVTSYNWTLTDITPDGPATDVVTPVSGQPNTPIPPRTFNLLPGKTFAVLQYTITAINSYTMGGETATCQQTQTILIRFNKYPVKVSANGIVYVTVNGAGNKDGSTWAHAYPGLADPLLLAQTVSDIKQIWVARGIYYPLHKAEEGASEQDKAFVMVSGVKVYGGFAGTEATLSQRKLAQNTSVLSGDDLYHTVISAGNMTSGADTARLDGFTVRNGKANGSGTITVNSQPISANRGGGIYFANSSPNIANVEIRGNEATEYGGGIYANNSSPKLVNTVVSGNLSAVSGGGIYLSGGSPALTNITVSGNRATTSGGGIYTNSSSPQIGNSILWGNAAGSSSNVHSTGGSPSYQYSLVQDLNPSGAGNIDGTDPSNDPVFVYPIPASSAPTIHGYYRPQFGSSALNAGNNALNSEPTDIESSPRIQESRIEAGAYEVNYNFECNCE